MLKCLKKIIKNKIINQNQLNKMMKEIKNLKVGNNF